MPCHDKYQEVSCNNSINLKSSTKDNLVKNAIFKHDNAKPYVAKIIKDWLGALPPYSPNLAPSDYHLFLSLSNGIKEGKFENEEELKTVSS